MTTIPASQIVSVTPAVLSAGGRGIDLNGLMLTNNTRVPFGQVLSFPPGLSVANYFGPDSDEAKFANAYFLGFISSDRKPGALLFSQFPQGAIAGWLRGGNIASMPLATLQSQSGLLTLVIDGVSRTTANIDLSGATSFSSAAATIQAALTAALPTGASFTASLAGNVLTVTAVGSGIIQAGQILAGSGVPGGMLITGFGTGTGGTGTYTTNNSAIVSSEAMTGTWGNPTVTFDAQSGGFVITSGTVGATSTMGYASNTLAPLLSLTQALGAVSSQGSNTITPAAMMNKVVGQTADWASFMTVWEATNTHKLQFAAWNNAQNNRFMYVCWDTDVSPTTGAAPSSVGGQIKAADYSGVAMVYKDPAHAAFVMGVQASLDFTALNGRATTAFRAQQGLTPSVSDGTSAQNLQANGYNFYGTYATAAQQFNFIYNGQVSGEFLWIDSYVDQIYMNSQLQLTLMTLLLSAKSVPYNHEGYGMISSALLDPIRQAVDFGAIRRGVVLSELQAALINEDVGNKVDNVIYSTGWYLLVADPGAQARALRQSPRVKLWYTDGQSVQQINVTSTEVQ